MHNAPSVSYPVGRSVWEALALAVTGLVGGGAIGWGWWAERLASPVAPQGWSLWWLGLGLWLAWLLAAGWHWRRQPAGVLQWDARATPERIEQPPGGWFWRSQSGTAKPVPVNPERVFDGQRWLLLRLHGPWRMGLWVWLERKADPSRWDDVRRALVQAR